jgi:hypothetical protein
MRCHALACQVRRIVESAAATQSICPESFVWFSQMAAIRLPEQTDLEALDAVLRARYRVEMPLIRWGRLKLARLSVQAYTTVEDLQTLIGALLAHLPRA